MQQQYQTNLGEYLQVSPNQIRLFWKGRVALYASLKAMGIGPGDEVILPGFTCVVVPNAIFYLGAIPIYVDINSETLCCDLADVEASITTRTKAIVIQNMLGLNVQVNEIVAMAASKGIYTIEDCTHGFGGKLRDKFCGTFADVSFFSTQWNKPFSTGIGGILVINNSELTQPISLVDTDLVMPSFKESSMLSMLIFARRYFLKGWVYWQLLRVYRFLSKHGWVIGSSSSEELEGITMPDDYFKGMSEVQCKQGMKALRNLDKILAKRKSNALIVHEWLKTNGKKSVPDHLIKEHTFLRYPILVGDRGGFMELAEQANLPLGDWFISPLHPIEGELSKWKLKVEDVPVSVKISSQIVNLPLEGNPKVLMSFLEKNITQIN